jgi:hypothetical protein
MVVVILGEIMGCGEVWGGGLIGVVAGMRIDGLNVVGGDGEERTHSVNVACIWSRSCVREFESVSLKLEAGRC